MFVTGVSLAFLSFCFLQPVKAADTPGVLSADQLAALKHQVVDEKTGNNLALNVIFARNSRDPGKAAFRVAAMVLEFKKGEKTRPSLIMEGDANFYLLDSAGKVVVGPMTESLGKMCPS